ncbi:MAG: hypothetical protein K2G26_00060, partial [Clostridia bacterium]|nr:hypothetical protein [Clostridia bacterium]
FSFLKTDNKVTASAYTADNLPTGTNAIGNIYDLSKGRFDRLNLDKLAKKAGYKNIDDMIDGVNNGDVKTSADFGNTVVNFGRDTKNITTTQEIAWIPAYLSNSTQGPILTLFLASNSTPYTFSDGSHNNNANTNPSSNNYSTSKVRAVTLNNGGTYCSGYGAGATTQVTPKSNNYTATSNNSNPWEMFTTGALASYIVSPSAVSWQSTAKKMKNDPLWAGNNTGKYTGSGWLNDKLWLPSVYEIYDNTIADNSTATTFAKNGGLWQLSANSIENPERYWTRSALATNAYSIMQIRYDDCQNVGVNATTVSVRPALHLNLSAAAENATIDAPGHIDELTYDGESKWIDNLSTKKPEWLNLELYNSTDYMTPSIVYTDTKGVETSATKDNVKEAGTYRVTMNLASGLKWSDNEGTGGRSFTITVKKAESAVTVDNPYSDPVYMPSKLPDLTNATDGGTKGTFSWRTQTPKIGINDYTWYFTPDNDISYNPAEGTLTFDFMEDSILSIEVTKFNENNDTIYTNTPLTTLKSYFKVSAIYSSTKDSDEPLKSLTAFIVQIDNNNGKLVAGSNDVTIFTSDYAKSTSYTINNVQELSYTQIVTLNFSQTTFTYPVTEEQIRDKISLFKVKRNDEQTVDVDKSEATVEGDLTVGSKTLTLKLGDLSKTFNVTIEKGTYDMDGVELSGEKTVTYDGDTHALTLSGTLPEGVTAGDITYTKQGGTPSTTAPTDAGTYTVKVSFTGDAANYNTISDVTATLTIGKATHEIPTDYETTKQFTYTGSVISLPVNWIDVPEGVTVKYYEVVDGVVSATEFTGATGIKVYNLKAVFTVADPANYNVPAPVELTFEITNKKIYTLSVTFEDGTFTYDGQSHTIAIDGELPDWITVKYYKDDGVTEFTGAKDVADSGTVIAKFTHNDPEYADIPDMTAVLTINKADYDMSGITFGPKTEIFNGTEYTLEIAGTLPDWITVTYSVEGQTGTSFSEAGVYTFTATFTHDNGNYKAIAAKTATLTISDAVVTEIKAELEVKEYTTASTLEDIKAKLTVTAVYNNGTTADVTDYELSFTGLRDNGKLKYGNQSLTVTYKVGDDEFTAVINNVMVTREKVALPVYNGGLKYTGVSIKPTVDNFTGFDSELMTFVVDKTIPGLAVGSYKAVFALNDPENYEWATTTTLKKNVFAVALYEGEVTLLANEAAVDWNIAKAVLTATKKEGALPEFASESFVGALSDVVAIKYYKDEACTEEVAAADLARETQYFVKAELLDTENFELDASAAAYTVKSFSYTTPAKELTTWDKIVRFLKTNWLWLVIAVVALVLLITIIALIARSAKKKREREELAEQRRLEKEEREREERRLEREERMARMNQQQMPSMMMPQMMPQMMGQMPQMQMPQQQSVPQQQPMATGGGASSNEIAELKAEISALRAAQESMRAEQTAKELAEIKALQMAEQQIAQAKTDMRVDSLSSRLGGEQIVSNGLTAATLVEMVTTAMEKVLDGREKPAAQPAPATPESNAAPAAAQVPPDAVMTTVTTTKIDTTKKP